MGEVPPERGLFGVVEKLLAGAAVAGAAIYVLLNALYVEYLDDFGLRPEDVGLDRLAVVGRAAWIALLGLGLTGIALGIAAYVSSKRVTREIDRRIHSIEEAADPKAADELAEFRKVFEEMDGVYRAMRLRRILLLTASALVLLLLLGFVVLREQVENRAADAKAGYRVGGIGWLVEIVDVRALPARVTWIGDKDSKPADLTDQTYLYLGRGDSVVAVLTCNGSTHMLRPDDVLITILEQTNKPPETNQICP